MALGISLAGLFVVWQSTKCKLFDLVGSSSGSFWYDSFTSWLKEQKLQMSKLALTLGEREAFTKNPCMKSINEDTQEVQAIAESKGIPCSFAKTPGNHFNYQEERLTLLLNSLLED